MTIKQKEIYKKLKESPESDFFDTVSNIYNCRNSLNFFQLYKKDIDKLLELRTPELKLYIVLARYGVKGEVKNITNERLAILCGWKNTSHISKYLKALKEKNFITIFQNKTPNDNRKNLPNKIYFTKKVKAYYEKIDNENYIKIQYQLIDQGIIAKWKSVELRIYLHSIRLSSILSDEFFFSREKCGKCYTFHCANLPSINKLSKVLNINKSYISDILNNKSFTSGDGYIIVNSQIIFINYYALFPENKDRITVETYLEDIIFMLNSEGIEYKHDIFNEVHDIFNT